MESIEYDIDLLDAPKNGIRLHILGLAHTITRDEYSNCAYTGKIQRFAPMMRSCGYEVYHYGIEGSISGADKNFNVLNTEEWNHLEVTSYKFLHPTLNDAEVIKELNDKTKMVGKLGNYTTPLYKEYNKRLNTLLKTNYRSIKTDIICLPYGPAHNDSLVNLKALTIESGIGYSNSFANYRIFESDAWLHSTLSKEKKWGQFYWFVVPNYFNVIEWPLNLKPIFNTIGFFGRIIKNKGMDIVVNIANRFPHIKILICGQGDPTIYLNKASNIIYKPPISGKERAYYLNSLVALIAPTTFIEPFCGVAVEAQLCGTPVITVDYGALTETIEQFKTGIRCHTLADFCYGVQMALDGKFNRQYIHNRAVEKYDMYNIAKKYDYTFKNMLDIHNGKGGWHAKESHLECLK